MIIDIHTHLWHKAEVTPYMVEYLQKRSVWSEWYMAVSAGGLLQVMDSNNIKVSIVSAVGLGRDTGNDYLEGINKYVLSQVKKSPDRLLGFCTVDPLGGKKSIELLKNNIEKNGFIGLKLHPSIQSFYPDDKRIYPLYEIMQEYGLPILFHTGFIGITPFKDKYSNPVNLDDVACDFPELKIIMGHAGKIWHEEAAMLLRKHGKIFADISGNIGRDNKSRSETLKNFLFLAKSYAGALDRVLFGTDYPLFFQDETIEVLEGARDLLNKTDPGFISDDDIKNIKYKNTAYLLDLDLNEEI